MPENISQLIWVLLLMAASIIGWLLVDKLRNVMREVGDAKAEARAAIEKAEEIERNYLDRFNNVNSHIDVVGAKILQEFNDLRVDMAKNYVQKSDCTFLHGK